MRWRSVFHFGVAAVRLRRTSLVSWVLLPIGFILGISGLIRSEKAKAASVAAVLISMIGSVVSAVNFLMLMAVGTMHYLPN